MTDIVALALAAVTLLTLLFKTFFSSEAAKNASDAKAAQDEAGRESAQAAVIQSSRDQAAKESNQVATIDDLADAYMQGAPK